MPIEVGKKSHVSRREVERAPAGDAAPPTSSGSSVSSAPALPAIARQAEAHDGAVNERECVQLGVEFARTPVQQGVGANARSLLLGQVHASRLGDAQRKFLKNAYRELASSSSLPDHLALRSLAAEQGVLGAFDDIMRAHSARLLPQLIDGAHVFAGAAILLAMQETAQSMDARAPFDEAIGPELKLALAWAKSDGERDEVNGLAARLGLSLADDTGPERAYQASPKHHGNAVQGGFVSPAPSNGQTVLNASVQVKPESPRRVGVDPDAREYVVFDETVPGTYHGHTRTWPQLHPDMQRALVAAGLCSNNGRML